jgi:rhamnosyltransferase
MEALTNPQISVVIPVKNGGPTIEPCLQGILAQTVKDSLEILVIDSGSTDGTSELLRNYPVQVHRIPPGEFNHGETRNLGARLAKGEFIVMTVQDARPADSQWIERMLQHFSDPRVAGVYGLQLVPHELDKNPMQWFRPVTKPEPRFVYFPNPEEFTSLPPRTQAELCQWDDVTAMYRRSALLETPFQRVSFYEDVIWAKEALLKGYALVYEPRAQVCHYHHQTFPFRFRRVYTIHYHHRRCFHHAPSGGALLRPMVSSVYHLCKVRALSPLRRLRWIAYNVRLILSTWLADKTFTVILCLLGDKALDLSHAYICKEPPQAAKASRPEKRNQRLQAPSRL